LGVDYFVVMPNYWIKRRLEGHDKELVKSTDISHLQRLWDKFFTGEKPIGLDTYLENVWVYAAIYVIATQAARTPWHIFRVEGDKLVPYKGEALRVLSAPNDTMSGFDLIERTVLHLELTGRAYWELAFEGDKYEIYVIQPNLIEAINIDPKGRVRSYRYRSPQSEIARELPSHKVVYFHYAHPLSEYDGMSPLLPAEHSIAADKNSVKFTKYFFQRGLMLQGVLESDYAIPERERRRLREEWAEMLSGIERAFSMPPVLEGGIRYREIATNPKDIQFVDLRKMAREEILAALGVPPILIGLTERASYANARVQERVFWLVTMLPKLTKIEWTITNQLLRRHFANEGDLIFKFDTSEVEMLTQQSRRTVGENLTTEGKKWDKLTET